MSDLSKENKLKYIKETSDNLEVTAYEYGKNTTISVFTARQILNGKTENPSSNTLDVMMKYLKSKNTHNALEEPTSTYITKDKTQLLRIAVEFAENYEAIKDIAIVRNIIKIEVLKERLAEKEKQQ